MIMVSGHVSRASSYSDIAIALWWTIRDRGARADLAEFAGRNGLTFRDGKQLILRAAAPW